MPQRRRKKESPQQIARTRKQHIWILLVAGMLAYLSVLPGGHIWSDTEDYLQGLYRLQSMSDIGSALTMPRAQYIDRFDGIDPAATSGTWQPVVILSNTIDWILWSDCAFCSRLENIALHLLVVVGLYALGRHLLEKQSRGNSMAFWAAILFAVHPAGVIDVGWLGGRPVLLATVFATWSLVFFSRLQATTNTPRKHKTRWEIGTALCAAAAALSHEFALMLPLAAYLVAGFSAKQRHRSAITGIAPMRWQGLAFLIGALAIVLLLRLLLIGDISFAGTMPTESTLANIGMALRHFWYFLAQTLLPGEPVISDAWPVSTSLSVMEVAAFVGALLIAVLTLVWLRRGYPAAFGIAWFFIWILPAIGVFPGERYHREELMYLASWGITFSFTYGLFRLWRPIGRQLAHGSETIVFALPLLILLPITAFSNARFWDTRNLFEGELSLDPHYIQGRIELGRLALRNDQPVEALNHLLEAPEAAEDQSHTGFWNKTLAFRLLGETQLKMSMYADAQSSFEVAVEGDKYSAENWRLLGLSKLRQENFSGAAEDLARALEIKPGDSRILETLAELDASSSKSE